MIEGYFFNHGLHPIEFQLFLVEGMMVLPRSRKVFQKCPACDPNVRTLWKIRIVETSRRTHSILKVGANNLFYSLKALWDHFRLVDRRGCYFG